MEYPKLSPTSDMLIHYLFTSSGSEPILKSFVNAVLEDSGRPLVKELMINNPFNPKDFMDDKLTIMDISAEDVNGRKFEIEIQKINHPAFVDRILLYWAKEFCGQLQEGDLYQSLTPVVSIVVTEFPLFPMLTDIHNDFYITARKTPDYVLTDDLEMHFIELSTEKTGQIPYLHELLRG